MSYKILELDNLPEPHKNKPRWVSCVVFSGAVLMITLSAVTVGVLLGYTYCYIEHRSAISSGNVTQSPLQILHMPHTDSEEEKLKRTINGALMTSIIMSRILKVGHAMMGDDLICFPFSQDEHITDIDSL